MRAERMLKIRNPILEGFNPDPCILKAKGKYYIAVSTFEWLPGIRIYESNDLVNWEFCTAVLDSVEMTNLQGNPKCCSIWAPHLSYAGGIYYLVYTDVKSTKVPFKDVNNYLTTAADIYGPWSKPIYLNSSGFDPSLYHDDNGRKWLVNEIWDYRIPEHNRSAGIVLQEYDVVNQVLIGKVYKIFDGTTYAKTEAPQIYHHAGYYYLLTAEGGTEEGHMVTVARSSSIQGQYAVDPKNPMLTSRDDPSLPLQCAGHASLVETDSGEWYLAHLCTRPVQGKYPILGRETALQKVIWSEDGWLRLVQGGHSPALEISAPKNFVGEILPKRHAFQDDFSTGKLLPQWNTLRLFAEESWLQFSQPAAGVRIWGGQSPQSTFEQHMIAIRQRDFDFQADTALTFRPESYMQMAGLLLYLDIMNYAYLYISRDEQDGIVVQLMKVVRDAFIIRQQKVKVSGNKVKLSVKVHGVDAIFAVAEHGLWQEFATEDISFLSGGYTGNFIGVAVQDLGKKNGCYAEFASFSYIPEFA